ncbi:MAG: hypothetical protein HY099_04805 [Nitrospirae bacterium]|nr:hypothetical protein [Nitrospirota bacterium]
MEDIKQNLISTVNYLSKDIGERSYRDIDNLNKAADYIESKFRSYGCDTKRQPFHYKSNVYYNIIAEVKGTKSADKRILLFWLDLIP